MERDQNFNFRQPLVTASGIILGFALNFAIPLVVSRYRIFDNRYDREHADRYYKRTLNYFLAGVIFSFLGALVRMTYTLMIPGL